MAFKRIKKYNENDIIGEYHKVNTINSAFDTIEVEIYASEQDRLDFKNGIFNSRFKKTDTFTNYRAGLKELILNATELPTNCNNLQDAIIHYAYVSLTSESDYYTSEYFEEC